MLPINQVQSHLWPSARTRSRPSGLPAPAGKLLSSPREAAPAGKDPEEARVDTPGRWGLEHPRRGPVLSALCGPPAPRLSSASLPPARGLPSNGASASLHCPNPTSLTLSLTSLTPDSPESAGAPPRRDLPTTCLQGSKHPFASLHADPHPGAPKTPAWREELGSLTGTDAQKTEGGGPPRGARAPQLPLPTPRFPGLCGVLPVGSPGCHVRDCDARRETDFLRVL